MDKKSPLYFALDVIVNLVMIVALALFIRSFIISPFHVFGPSMCSTLNDIDGQCVSGYGEYIIVNEIGYIVGKPDLNDIIIFKPPNNDEEHYVKRVIGMPGDKIRIEDGYVYKWDGNQYGLVDESGYLDENLIGKTFISGRDFVEYEVPEDMYFVLGDNRTRSTDSRNCFSGSFGSDCYGQNPDAFVPVDRIRGKASVVFWPFKSIRIL